MIRKPSFDMCVLVNPWSCPSQQTLRHARALGARGTTASIQRGDLRLFSGFVLRAISESRPA